MAMVKRGISFQNSVVETVDGVDAKCESCGNAINMMTSTKGIVVCRKCGHQNQVQDMESPNE
jgi:ribosomal protein L37AE/L43A